MLHALLVMLFFATVAADTVVTDAAQAAQSAAAAECQRINDSSFESYGWDGQARVRTAWIASCRRALVADPDNSHLKHLLARALTADGQRGDAIALWRELGDQNDAAALFEIYDMYKSYFRRAVNEQQLVERAEAERALRKAAALGDPYSILMLAVLLDRGTTVKRDNAQAIYWAERAVASPSKDVTPVDMQVLLGRLLVKSDDPTHKARGIDLLEGLARSGRSDAKAYLAGAIRASDTARARALYEEGLRGAGGAAVPALADMLAKGEGGLADPKRAFALLTSRFWSDVPGVKGALGQAYLEGKLAPRDMAKGVGLLSMWARWDYDARLQLMALLAANPEQTITYPEDILYDATEAIDLGEPGAVNALINLKLSRSAQFGDKPGGCALARVAAKNGDETAAGRLLECAGD
jgi:TPR repeat protein